MTEQTDIEAIVAARFPEVHAGALKQLRATRFFDGMTRETTATFTADRELTIILSDVPAGNLGATATPTMPLPQISAFAACCQRQPRGVATQALTRGDAERLAVIGCSEQAEHHLDTKCAVRAITHVYVAERLAEKIAAFCTKAKGQYPDITFQRGDDIKSTVAEADIICTVTHSSRPILEHR